MIWPFGAMDSFSAIGPAVGPNWKLRAPSFRASSCAVCDTLLPSVALNRSRLEG